MLEHELRAKVPVEIQEQAEFKLLVDTIGINRITSKESLLAHIEKQIGNIGSWLKKNNSTGVETIIAMSNNIARQERLKGWKGLCEKYL